MILFMSVSVQSHILKMLGVKRFKLLNRPKEEREFTRLIPFAVIIRIRLLIPKELKDRYESEYHHEPK